MLYPSTYIVRGNQLTIKNRLSLIKRNIDISTDIAGISCISTVFGKSYIIYLIPEKSKIKLFIKSPLQYLPINYMIKNYKKLIYDIYSANDEIELDKETKEIIQQ